MPDERTILFELANALLQRILNVEWKIRVFQDALIPTRWSRLPYDQRAHVVLSKQCRKVSNK
jgi:hypothetical protein